jgi:zinc transport system permease protein
MDIDLLAAPTWADFVEGWKLGIYRLPVLTAAAAGFALGLLSVYIVLRRMVFLSAAVTQAAGFGVAFAFYAGIHLGFELDPSHGAVLAALAAAGILALDPRPTGLSREMVLGLVFALAGGGAVLLGARISQEAHDIQAILFGPAVLVSDVDARRVITMVVVVTALHGVWFRGFSFASFDRLAARVQGVPVRALDAVLLLSIGVMIGVSARALGALPVFALSTMPGIAAALLLRGNLLAIFALASVTGALIGATGYLVAFFYDLPVGASQTVVAVVVALVALLVRAGIDGVRRLGARG